MNSILDREVDLDIGCTVSCKRSLKRFYKSIGFSYFQKAENDPDSDVMILTTSANVENLDLRFKNFTYDDRYDKKNYKAIKKHLGISFKAH